LGYRHTFPWILEGILENIYGLPEGFSGILRDSEGFLGFLNCFKGFLRILEGF